MTELAHRDQGGALSPALDSDPTGGRLIAWARGLQAAHQLGTALCATSFVPKHFQGKPEEAAAAILFGDEIGLSPTQAVQAVYVVAGTPALRARSMVALVMAHGHEVWTVEDTPTRVVVAGRRRGSNRIEEVTWTTDRARKAGYTTNKRYELDPQGMLYARASGDVARRIAPDVLAGIAYTVEELELAEAPAVVVKRESPPPAKRTAKRAAIPTQRAEEPELPEPGHPPDTDDLTREPVVDDAQGDPITPAQSKMLHAAFTQAGITERAARLAYVSSVVGRDVATSDDLTKEEASRVIDALAAEPPGWGSRDDE